MADKDKELPRIVVSEEAHRRLSIIAAVRGLTLQAAIEELMAPAYIQALEFERERQKRKE